MRLVLVTLVVPDYDAAIAFYRAALGFEPVEDTPLGGGKRWVRIAPPGGGCGLLLALADGERQRAAIGNQTGGRVSFFINSDDFDADLARLAAAGAVFEDLPRAEPYGRVIVFRDPFGNRFDLIQPSKQALG